MNADTEQIAKLVYQRATMRTGRKLGRTLYLVPPGQDEDWGEHLCVGIVDSELMARAICSMWNNTVRPSAE